MYFLIDMRSMASPVPSSGDFFCEDFLHALFRNHPEDVFYLWTTGKDLLPEHLRFEDFGNIRRVHTGISSKRLHFLIQTLGYPSIDDLVETLAMKHGQLPWVAKFDAVFFSNPFPILLEENCFHVHITSHIKPILFPELYTAKSMKYHSKRSYKKALQLADCNIVPSEILAQEIAESFGVEEDSFFISNFGLPQYFEAVENSDDDTPQKNTPPLFVARCDYQSLHSVLEGFSLFRHRFFEYDFSVLCIEPFEGAFAHVSAPPYIRFVFLNSRDKRREVYEKAHCFIDASVYDTEGMYLLEAMRCKCAVISSSYGALPGIYPKETIAFDPYSQKSFFAALKKFHIAKEYAEKNAEEGYACSQKSEHSWDDIAMQILHEVKMQIEKREMEE